jgi:hypothetical protein
MMSGILVNMGIWELIGACFLNVIVIVVYKTGIVHTAREKDGTLKRKIPFVGILTMLIMLLLLVTFVVLFDYSTFFTWPGIVFIDVLMTNFVFVLLLSLYDALVIDILVLGIWKPTFLPIPEDVTLESMKLHVKKQFTVGWIFLLPIILISSAIYIVNFGR